MGPKNFAPDTQFSFRDPFLGLIVGSVLGSEKSVKKGEQKPKRLAARRGIGHKVNVASMPI